MDIVKILFYVTVLSQAIGGIWVVILAFQDEWIDGVLSIVFYPYLVYYAYAHYNDKQGSTKFPSHILILGLIVSLIALIFFDLPEYFNPKFK